DVAGGAAPVRAGSDAQDDSRMPKVNVRAANTPRLSVARHVDSMGMDGVRAELGKTLGLRAGS
ncbi:MAG TPA: hypothetical protein VK439_01610, partial [Rubrivivax sp.]|nr:hypothetical protein [Rubrivivax sp.]